MKTFAALPMMFEANSGQTDPRVKFLSHAPGYTLFLTDQEAVLALPAGSKGSASANAAEDSQKSPGLQPDKSLTPTLTRTVRLKFAGGNTPAAITGRNQLPGKTSYFLGNDPTQWHRNIANYEGVEYRRVYPGVDVVFHGNQQHLEYDFIVAPGADPHTIALDVEGADGMRITPRGDVVLGVGQSELELEKPVVYQELEGQRREVAGNFVLSGPRRIGFSLGPYDHSQPLVIDPTLAYSTYLGKVYLESTSSPAFVSVAVDSSGNAYIAGTTLYSSPSFVTSPSQTCPGDCTNPVAFVMEIAPGATSPTYSTYLGPNDSQSGYDTRANAIGVDGSGNAYVAGQTNAYNFPVTSNIPTPAVPACGFSSGSLPPSGKYCGFVTELSGSSATGPDLVYSTYIGGAGGNITNIVPNNVVTGIAVDSMGDAYVTGYTTSPTLLSSITSNNGQALPLGFQMTFLGSPQNAFVAELQNSASGPYFSYLSYLGGSGSDTATAIAVSPNNGEAFVVGATTSTNFPTVNAYQSSLQGPNASNQNAFFSAVVSSGAGASPILLYSTYLGGTGADIANAVASDAFGYAYITGNLGLTTSSNYEFPVNVNTTCSTSAGGSVNACPLMFVAEMTPSAVGSPSLVFSSYLGGDDPPAAGIESAQGIAVDGQGNVFVTGWEKSAKDTSFPLVGVPVSSTAVQPTDPCLPLPSTFLFYSECSAGFLVEFSPGAASVVYSTFLGVTAVLATPSFPIVQGTGVALDPQQEYTYVAGLAGGYTPLIETTSPTFMANPTDEYTGTYDRNAFLSVISGLAKPTCQEFTVGPSSLPAGTVGAAYSQQFNTDGGASPITFSATGLPTGIGMSFTSGGLLSGTPTTAESLSITVAATDSNGCIGYPVTDTLTINSVTGPPPQVSSIAPNIGAQGQQNLQVTITGANFVAGSTTVTIGADVSAGITVNLVTVTATSITAQVSIPTSTPAASYDVVVTVNGAPPPATLTGGFIVATDSEQIIVDDQETVTPLINFAGPAAWFSNGDVEFNGQSGILPLTVSNVGEGSLVFTGAPAISSTSGTFTITQTVCSNLATSLPTTLPSGGACTFTISYTPSTPSTDGGTIVFTDNAALSSPTSTLLSGSYTQTITLSGEVTTASTPPLPPATVTVPVDNEPITVNDQETVTPLINFAGPAAWFSTGDVEFNGQSGILPLTVSNVGEGSLVFTGAPAISSTSGTFTITQTVCSNLATSLPTTLPSGGACTFTISYTPSTPSTDGGTIVFTDNAALSSPTSTLLSGSYTQTITLSGEVTTVSTPPLPPTTVTVPVDNETITVTDTPSPE